MTSLFAALLVGPASLEQYVVSLRAAKTLRVEARVTTIGGATAAWKLLGQKPVQIRLSMGSTEIRNFEPASALQNPVLATFAPFWSADAFAESSPKALGLKTRQGVTYEMIKLTFASAKSSLTLYLDRTSHLPRQAEFESSQKDEKVLQVVDFGEIEFDPTLTADAFEASKSDAPTQPTTSAYKPKYRLTGTLEPGEVPYKRLTFDDFQIRDGGGPFDAATVGFCRYSYRASVSGGGSQYRARAANLKVVTGFNKKDSWRRPHLRNPDHLLEHEQGHLDLHEIYTRDLALLNASDCPVGLGTSSDAAMADLDQKLSAFFSRTLDASQKEADRYDLETNHGSNHAKQAEWSASIRKRLLG